MRPTILVMMATLALSSSSVAAPVGVGVELTLVAARHGIPSMDPELAPIGEALARLPFEVFRQRAVARWRGEPGDQGRSDLGPRVSVHATVSSSRPGSATVVLDIFVDDARVTHTSLTRPLGASSLLAVARGNGTVMVVGVRLVP